jgi:hypothetical protein
LFGWGYPNGVWMAQVARNKSMIFAEEKVEYQPTHIIRDRSARCRGKTAILKIACPIAAIVSTI